MKKILIAGKNSYLGTSFEKYLAESFPDRYQVFSVSLRDEGWKQFDFSPYDAVLHVAGIAHIDNRTARGGEQDLYFSVNTDLAVEVAQKAKSDGVSQFVFMSSIAVYGDSSPIGREKMIDAETGPDIRNCYSQSKRKAEIELQKLEGPDFRVAIIRAPMVYGKDCKGNYNRLREIALKHRFFPDVHNARSMLYIGNCVEFIRLLIEHTESGIFFPQNAEYSDTAAIICEIASLHGRKVRLIPGTKIPLRLLSLFVPSINKAFGNLTYSMELSRYPEDYRIFSLQESIRETEL